MATRLRSPDARSVVALLATRGRFDLLALRALPSILAQSRLPDRILVVVDQPPSELSDEALAEQARRLRAICRGRVRLTVMRNRRTPTRASGAWNTGLDQLHRDIRQPDLGFVAVLPFFIGLVTDVRSLTISSTGFLIVVSVVLDTMKQLEAQLLMRNYEGFIR